MDRKNFENMDFETAMKRLDEIGAELEATSLKLDETLALYEEGLAYVAHCKQQLDEAERRITVLAADENGEVTEKPFSVPEAE